MCSPCAHLPQSSCFLRHAVACADGHGNTTGAAAIAQSGGFKLGGAASRTALVPLDTEPPARRALRLPTISLRPSPDAMNESTMGPATVFLRESLEFGRDALQLGTFLSRGSTRAGVSVTYSEDSEEVSQSQIFLDYAVTDQFSIGVAGILDNETNDEEPVRQLGLNAGFATEGGAFLRGGVASADDYEPVFGLSIGLRF